MLWAGRGVVSSAYPLPKADLLKQDARGSECLFAAHPFCPQAAPEPLRWSLLFRGLDVLLADLEYSVSPLTLSQIYMYYCSREMNKCSSQFAFSRTSALLMSAPSLPCPLLTSGAMCQVG